MAESQEVEKIKWAKIKKLKVKSSKINMLKSLLILSAFWLFGLNFSHLVFGLSTFTRFNKLGLRSG